jgi:hypothetical protein
VKRQRQVFFQVSNLIPIERHNVPCKGDVALPIALNKITMRAKFLAPARYN